MTALIFVLVSYVMIEIYNNKIGEDKDEKTN